MPQRGAEVEIGGTSVLRASNPRCNRAEGRESPAARRFSPLENPDCHASLTRRRQRPMPQRARANARTVNPPLE